MREASTPFSVTRYALVLTARCSASFAPILAWRPVVSEVAAVPVMASFAFGSRCALRAMSSRQALASLSTRAGRRASRSKLTVQRLVVVGAGGGVVTAGAATVTVVICDAV